MCLILFSYEKHPQYRLILAANRDEFYERPTAPLAAWDSAPEIFAGRDLRGQGTWLGITRSSRFAAITNYRDPASVINDAPSRSLLISNFLKGDEPAESYLAGLEKLAAKYNGYNILAGDPSGLWYYSNRENGVHKLPPGHYGLSNHLLDTQWPKVTAGKSGLKKLLASGKEIHTDRVFDLLADRTIAPDHHLPRTGVDLAWERTLSARFITSENYGTRSSSIILIKKTGEVTFLERTFNCGETNKTMHQTRCIRFTISDQRKRTNRMPDAIEKMK
jgi:uncharacterized protein with NRDE domain